MYLQVVYILDQVRALEHEMKLKLKQQGLDVTPRILIVRVHMFCRADNLSCVYLYIYSLHTYIYILC